MCSIKLYKPHSVPTAHVHIILRPFTSLRMVPMSEIRICELSNPQQKRGFQPKGMTHGAQCVWHGGNSGTAPTAYTCDHLKTCGNATWKH